MGTEDSEIGHASSEMYRGKYILAPMVRVGTLPARLVALKYGADLVYTEEIIDFKLLKTTRIENKVLNTVDFVLNDGSAVFRTCQAERKQVVFQVGTADPERALKTAKMVENDVAAFDVNMGCPKDYSVKGGMGAALLQEPEKVYNILSALVKGVSIPVTCKIRILPTIEETVKLAKVIQSAGVAALAVHGRQKHERSREPVHRDVIKAVADALTIPVIANGGSLDIETFNDMEEYRHQTGCASVMVARVAQWNLSVFRRDGLLPRKEVVKEYIRTAVDCDNVFANTKFCALKLLHEEHTTEVAHRLRAAKDTKELCEAVDLLSHYKDALKTRHSRRQMLEKAKELAASEDSQIKRRLSDDSIELVEMKFKFQRTNYPNDISPKSILCDLSRSKKLPDPSYEIFTLEEDRLFKSVVTFDNVKYTSTEWEKSKRFAEQASAVVCLTSLGVSDGRLKEDEET